MGSKIAIFTMVAYIILKNSQFVNGSAQALKQTLSTMFSNHETGIRPYYGEKPVQVGVTAYILSVEQMSEKNMDFTISMYLRQNWDDPRLGFGNSQRGLSYSPLARNITSIGLDESRSKLIWKPDTYFVNEKKAHKHDITTTNEFFRISPNGTVIRSTRYTVTLSCPMNLRHFPFDSQLCSAELESFSGNKEYIIYYWKDGFASVGFSSQVSLPEFKIIGYKVRASEISLSSGSYSRLAIDILLKRSFGYHLLRAYLPMLVLVFASGISLLLASPIMGPLIQTVIIIFMTLHSEMSWLKELPQISFMTGLHCYAIGCLGLVGLAFIVSLGDAFNLAGQSSPMHPYCNPYKTLSELDKYKRASGSKQNACNGTMLMICFLKWTILILFIFFNILYCLYYKWVSKVNYMDFTLLPHHD